MRKFNIAILGLGTVGGGTYDILKDNGELIKQRLGADYEVTRILEINDKAIAAHGVDPSIVTSNIDDIICADDIDIMVESLGGVEPSSSWMLTAMEHGISVVTPNKAAVAANFEKLQKTAAENNVEFRFEASVGGGIPCLTSILEPLSGNQFSEVRGILNGTTNYILSRMENAGLTYEEALLEAQQKGFAEADPTADVEGIDCANKLAILMALCFGKVVDPMEIPREGITKVTMDQIKAAAERGCRIKLISKAELAEDGSVTYSIAPEEVALEHPLAGVNNEYNAIYVRGNAVDDVMLYGKGAGALPTGSAIVGDVNAIMRTLLLK